MLTGRAIGRQAKEPFASSRIEVITGAPAGPPDKLVPDYLSGSLETGRGVCDH